MGYLIFKIVIFLVVSVGIILLSWKSLKSPRSHGFFRFFAFESILVLILLNAEHWFQEPFSTLQVISWLLLLSSLVMAVHGFYLLRMRGKPAGKIENTTILVKRGAYKYIRHPLYSSLLLLQWGVFLKYPSLFSAIAVFVASAFLVATAKVEEAENLHKFGAEYASYVKTTKMFIPFLI